MLEAREVEAPWGLKPGLNLSIPAGRFVGLLGPNGAGKSTLLRLLSGGLKPKAGALLAQGEPVAALSAAARARRLAVVPQTVSLDFDFSVEEVVAQGRHPYLGAMGRFGEADRQALEAALAELGLTALRTRSVRTLSGGERQRVLLARALCQSTPVLLLDEPTAHLDPAYRVELLACLRGLARRGQTVVAALHDLNLAAQYCDHLVLLKAGQVRVEGPPSSCLTAAWVEEVFGVAVSVVAHPQSGRGQLLFLEAAHG